MRGTSEKIHQTTLRLPTPLYEKAKRVIEHQWAGANTFNELVVLALRSYLKAVNRRRIDDAFAQMAEDTDYRKEAYVIAAEFEVSDWEALESVEGADLEVDASR